MSSYTAVPAADMIVRAADGLFVIYHRPSGQTHVLEPVMVAILGALGEQPLDAAGVLAILGATHDLEAEPGESPLAVIAARLGELDALGLVEAVA